MVALLLGFLGLVIFPALLIAGLSRWFAKEPSEPALGEESRSFTLSLDKGEPACDTQATLKA